MRSSELEVELMSRRRVRAGLWLVIGFLIVLAGIAGNDFYVQAGQAHSPKRLAMLVLMGGGGVLLLASLARLVSITRRSINDGNLRQELWDELALANHRHAMTVAYLAMLLVLVVLAVVSMIATLSAPWVVNGVMLTGLGAHAVAFALLERRGDDGR